MKRREMLKAMAMVSAMAGIGPMEASSAQPGGASAGAGPVFELRVYHTNEGKLDDLLARFRDHTLTIFKRHGMESVGYWTPMDEPLKGRTLFYMLKHPSREAATANWAAFNNDPEWKQISAATNANGRLVAQTDSTFLVLTDFSPRL